MEEEKKRLYFRKVETEPYAKLLNIKLKDVDEGYALCEMEYTERLDNIYGIAHGGAIFSLIDEAFEISSNSYQNVAVALNMNVTYIRAPKKNTILTAESKEIYRTKRTASYYITVRDDENLLAVCQALVYIKDREIPFLEELRQKKG
ncbi:MAG: PaaI family thioesterase [Desulfobacterota bacterium]|nr:PaaI family thioesterase [Thermodesulfobacteriota bacterium]MDW8002272.1 PaaI family thioesterase [Deltaproteobacteria bacterium]